MPRRRPVIRPTSSSASSSTVLNGPQGATGWSPIFAVVSDSARRVLRVTDWTGGGGSKPSTGDYLGSSGLTSQLADAIDIRGASGATGATGANGSNGATGPQGPVGPIFFPALSGFPPGSAAASTATSGVSAGVNFPSTGTTAFLYRLIKPTGAGTTFSLTLCFRPSATGNVRFSARASGPITVGGTSVAATVVAAEGLVVNYVTLSNITPSTTINAGEWLMLEISRVPGSESGSSAGNTTLIGFRVDWS